MIILSHKSLENYSLHEKSCSLLKNIVLNLMFRQLEEYKTLMRKAIENGHIQHNVSVVSILI